MVPEGDGVMNIKRIIPVALIAAAGLTVAACSSGTTAHVATPALKASQSASVPAGWGRVASATFTQTEWNVLNNLPSTGPTSGIGSTFPRTYSQGWPMECAAICRPGIPRPRSMLTQTRWSLLDTSI